MSPISVLQTDWLEQTLPVSITKKQVEDSPNIDTDKPVSRQNEEQTMGYCGYPNYWGGGGVWGDGLYPDAMVPANAGYAGYGPVRLDRAECDRQEEAYLRSERARHRNDDPHLRSCKTFTGYHIHATDGEVGHVSGYLVDDESWAILFFVVNTSNCWVGHKVLIAPSWITGVHWSDETVSINLSRESVKAAPAYDPDAMWSRALDSSLYQHYGKTAVWTD